MIAVTFALPAESSAFVRDKERSDAKARLCTVSWQIKPQTSNVKFACIHTGVGATNVESGSIFFENERPQKLISSGFCGGTRDKFR